MEHAMSMAIPVTKADRARRLGAEQAIAMLREVQELENYCIDGELGEDGAVIGPQETSVVLRYLQALPPEQQEGFAAVLTDFLGQAPWAVPDVEFYEQLLAEGRI